jgi:hypothetical protein
MEEVLIPVARRNETKPFVSYEPFDRAIHRRHVISFVLSMCAVRRLPPRAGFRDPTAQAGATEVCRQSSHRK